MRLSLQRLALGAGGGGVVEAFSVTLTGLSTDSLGNYGEVGDHASIGYTIDPDNATETVKWSNSSDPDDSATYGTGAAPTDFTASDGSTVYLHVTDGGETVTRSFAVRKEPVSVAEALGPYSWTVDDDDISVDATSDFTLNGNTAASWVITGLPDGGVDDGDGSWSGTADPVAGDPMTGDSGTITVTLTDSYGRVYTSTPDWTTSLRAQATGGADLDLAYEEGTPTVNQDLTANWTDNGNTLGSAQVSPAVPTNMAVSGAGLLTRTGSLSITADDTYTLTMEDEYGRETSDDFTLEITEAVSSINPTISDIIFTDNNDGTPADLQVQGGYTGADTLDATLEFYDGASLVATATVLAVTVTSEAFDFTEDIEEADLTYEAGFDETDLPNVDSIEVTIEERNNGGSVGPTSEAVSGLSGVPPVITWATNAAGTQIIGTADKACYFTEDTADWSADGSTTGTLSISAVAGNGTTTITLTLSGGPLVNGETVTLDYTNSDTDLRGPDGNEVANFSGTSVTNNVSGSWEPTDLGSKLIAWWDFSDSSVLWTTTGRVANVTDTDTIAYVDDKSGRGNDLEYSAINSSTGGPEWSSSGYATYADQELLSCLSMSDLTSDMAVFSKINTTDQLGQLVGSTTNADHLGIWQSSGSGPNNNVGSPTFELDGASISSSSRQDLLNSGLEDGTDRVFAAFGANFTGAGAWGTRFSPICGEGGSIMYVGRLHQFIVTTNDLTSGELADLETFLGL